MTTQANPTTPQPLQQSVEIDGRTVAIELSKAASKALTARTTPLLVEMELYFSCLIRKQVRFRDTVEDNSDNLTVKLNDLLHIRFRPVMTRVCGNDYEGDEPPLTDFPIAKTRPYVPRWLHIDYRKDQWQGEFGYDLGQ
jgi:hypothetical protein